MSTNCHISNSFLRIMPSVLAVFMMVGCGAESGSSQVNTGNVIVSGDNGISSGKGEDGGSSGSGAVIATGSFSLSWTAPVSRQDGSPISLAEIEGYRVYYGGTPGTYPNIVDINDSTASATTVSNVPVGDYYIVMTTYDSAGRESIQSGVVNKQAL